MKKKLIIFLPVLLAGCSSSIVSLTPSGNYADSLQGKLAKIRIAETDTSILQLRNSIQNSRLVNAYFGAGNCDDDTGTNTIDKGALLSKSGRQWIEGSMVQAGLRVVTHSSDVWAQETRNNVNNLGALLGKDYSTPEQKATAAGLYDRESKILLRTSRSPDFVLRCSWSKFDRNIKTGVIGAESMGLIGEISADLGFQERYQVANLGLQFQIIDNNNGTVIDSYEVEKQLIASERKFALLGVDNQTGNDDTKVQVIPITRQAEATNEAQKRLVEYSTVQAIKHLLQHYN